MSKKERKSPRARFWAVAEIERLRAEDGLSISEACETMAVSRTSYRRWRDSLAENPDYQQEKRIEVGSSRPKRNARQVSASTRQRVIDAAMDLGQSSANSIAHHLKASGIAIGTAKVIEILEEEGLYGEIQIKNAKGEYKRKKGLLRLCERRQQRDSSMQQNRLERFTSRYRKHYDESSTRDNLLPGRKAGYLRLPCPS